MTCNNSQKGSDNTLYVRIDKDLEEIIPEFIDLTKKDIESLHAALANSDYEKVRSIGHTLKGSGGGYGFNHITTLGAQIEEYAKTRNQDKIKGLIEDLSAYMDNVQITYE